MNDLELMAVAAKAAAAADPHNTKSNPRVGCVVTTPGDIIATGAHEVFGEAHAEVNAFKNYIPGCKSHPGMQNNDMTVYITLEPCVKSAGKKTAACTDLLLKINPSRVVIGSLDPHFPGQGVAQLKAAGINVEVLNSDHHQNLNPWFKPWIEQKAPYVTLKVAQSLDGKITPALKDYQQGLRALTRGATQKEVHCMRASHQALLTSTQTVLEDDPLLDVRHAKNLSHPISAPDVIIIGTRSVPKTSRLFSIPNRAVHFVEKLSDLNAYCLKNNLASIMTECGGTLNTALIEAGLVDRIEVFTAPIICGDTAKPSFVLAQNLSAYKLKSVNHLDNDLWQTLIR